MIVIIVTMTMCIICNINNCCCLFPIIQNEIALCQMRLVIVGVLIFVTFLLKIIINALTWFVFVLLASYLEFKICCIDLELLVF